MKFEDLFKCGPSDIPTPARLQLTILMPKLIQLEASYGKDFIITRGFSTWSEHKAIYNDINVRRAIIGKDPLPISIHSAHLAGNAADIFDADGALKIWIAANVPILEKIGFWMESFYATPTWVHVQQTPPASGNRFFKPY